MNDRINQLESLYALQDQTLVELNEEVFRQQQEITALQQRIDALEERIKQLGQPEPIRGNEAPPHW